jgi:hypothetical protein
LNRLTSPVPFPGTDSERRFSQIFDNMVVHATRVRQDGDVEFRDPITGISYRTPGQHWNSLIEQQRASYGGTLRMMEISPDDPELTVL